MIKEHANLCTGSVADVTSLQIVKQVQGRSEKKINPDDLFYASLVH